MSTDTSNPEGAVAVIGMAGRFPGATGVEELWLNVVSGVRSIRRFSDSELREAGVPQTLLADPRYVRAAAIIDGVEQFDAGFFGLSPREAELTDPQHRLFLECAWEALEDAGHDPRTCGGAVGVFAGSGFCWYLEHNLASGAGEAAVTTGAAKLQLAVGNDRDSLASTVSYRLDLRGPSVSVQTFCSTSLVAVHLACQSLLGLETDMALAGGVAIVLPQVAGYLYEEGGITSPDGECRAFDARAQGSVIGNGVGVVVLKRLEDALSDRDHVYAVIRGSAVNNDGGARAGYTAPGLEGQAGVISEALAAAGVDPATIAYVEAHGTGTALGDSIELAALARAFGRAGARPRSCAVGSIKPNVGHLDRASGVTGLIKACLALTHRVLPPSLNFERARPDARLDETPFYVNTRATPWPGGRGPRRAGVSSFGLGGTNAHVVLEEAPPAELASGPDRPELLVLSARSDAALERMAARLADHLHRHPELRLRDVAFTLRRGRTAFDHRLALVARDTADAADALAGSLDRCLLARLVRRGVPVTFRLPAHMRGGGGLAALVRDEPVFRQTTAECLAAAGTGLAPEARARLNAGILDLDGPAGRLAAFAAALGVARWLDDRGVRPAAAHGDGPGRQVARHLVDGIPAAEVVSLAVAEPYADGEEAAPFQVLLDGAGPEATVDIEAGIGRESLLDALARLWLAGVAVDWGAEDGEVPCRRVSLPTYPFERQRYWVDPRPASAPAPAPELGAARRADPAGWFWAPGWRQAPGLPAPDREAAGRGSPWLVLAGASPLAARVCQTLRERGAAASVARPGSGFADEGGGCFVVDPTSAADHRALLESLPHRPRAVLHLWSLDAAGRGDRIERFRAAQELGFHPLILLLQALGGGPAPADLALTCVTRGAFPVTGEEELHPEQATLAGPCLVLPQERAGVRCLQVDVSLPAPGSREEGRLAAAIVAEACQAAGGPVVAHRGVQRWVPAFEPLPVRDAALAPLRRHGTYLLTGGLGGVGMVLAEHLAAVAGARLILLGRSPFPPRSEWDAWLASRAPDDPTAVRIRRLLAMEDAGAEVMLVRADAGDPDQVREAIRLAQARFGDLHGAIHAAGISDPVLFGTAQEVSRAACEAHLTSKAVGACVLADALAGRHLDFCLLMSSLSSVLGGLGFVAYAAANAFLDSVAGELQREGQPWLSVNWEGWRVAGERHLAPGTTVAAYRMTPAEGVRAFELALGRVGTAHRVIVSSGDLHARLGQWVTGDRRGPRTPARHPRPRLATPFVAPAGELEEGLARTWGDVLGVEGVGALDDFVELGGHSLLAAGLLAAIRAELQVDVPITALLQARTVRALAPVVREARTRAAGPALASPSPPSGQAEPRLNQ